MGNHLEEVKSMPAPHLEISWTTRFNAFLPSLDYPDRFNYLSHDGGFPDTNYTFETDNEGTWFYPQVSHIVDTVNIMAYDAGKFDGKPYKLDFPQIVENFAKSGMSLAARSIWALSQVRRQPVENGKER